MERRSLTAAVYFLLGGWLAATPVAMSPLEGGPRWYLPGGEAGALVGGGAEAVVEVLVPALSDKEQSLPGAWRGIISVDAHGTADGGAGRMVVEALDPATGEVFASGTGEVSGRAPRAEWAVIASSAQGGAAAERAFDGDPKTDWHTRYGADQAKPPHWIGLEFGTPRRLEGVSFLPRQGGFTNGVPKAYRVEVRMPGGEWESVAKATTDREAVGKKRQALEVRFAEPREVAAFRFVVESDWSGGGFGTAAEVVPLGVELEKKAESVTAASRVWLEIPAELMTALTGKRFALRVKAADGAAVVAGTPRLCRVHEAPTKKLFGRSNGGQGPDKLGAGLLGFDALTEDGQTVLTVMTVRTESPAARAGLKPGDAIVSVAGTPLPVNDLAPGWKWLQRSHEAVLGRESEAVLAAGGDRLELGVMRGGKVEAVAIPLRRKAAFTTMNPADDPAAAALLEDMTGWLLKNQRDDGSWSGDVIRSTFASLAMLATGDPDHEARVGRAVDWALKRYPAPEKYGNLGFWAGAYTGILYCEWFRRTGDERVLPHLDLLRDWAVAGQHESKWGVPALGHGPSGLPYDRKSLVAPACHLLVFEALAIRCGMDSAIWELLLPYMEMAWSDPKEGGHGSLGYNRSYKDQGEFWSRSGLFAMACALRGERADMREAMTGFMRGHHPWIRNSHAYGEPGGAWGLLGLNLAEPEAYAEVMKEYRWWFSLAWEPGYGLRFTTPHMGAPYMGEDDLLNAAYALVLQAPKRNLWLTGAPRGE